MATIIAAASFCLSPAHAAPDTCITIKEHFFFGGIPTARAPYFVFSGLDSYSAAPAGAGRVLSGCASLPSLA